MAFIEIKGQLARLLATENLIVEHSPTVKTACFDVRSRILRLPVLNNISEQVYNMFIGHEVGHALWTPQDWVTRAGKNVPKDFLNVIEDVRIERMIQKKFPGIRKDFSSAYDELDSSNFFEIKDKDINKLPFIDRINLHFKLGPRTMIKFTNEEQGYINEISSCETFDDVCEVARKLAKFLKDRLENTQPGPKQVVVMPGGFGGDSGRQSSQSGGIDSQSGSPGSGSSDDGEEDGSGDKDNSDAGNGDQDSGENDANGEGESEDGGEGEDGDEWEQPDPVNVHEPDEEELDLLPLEEELESLTQEAFDKALERIQSKDKVNYLYFDRPKYNLNKSITDIKSVRENLKGRTRSQTQFDEFMSRSKSDVNFMVSRFEMKKSAAAYARAEIRKTGILDTRNLHKYKIAEDLFKRNTTVPDGKGHGMIMLIDNSGSMAGIIKNTIQQVLILTEFCRKTRIPYEVYMFTSGPNNSSSSSNNSIPLRDCKIIQVLSNSDTYSQCTNDMKNLYSVGCRNHDSGMFSMGGTPLNNTLFSIPEIIDRFRDKNKIQKVSFVCLTDGQSSSLMYKDAYNHYAAQSVKIFIRDKGGKVFDIGNGNTGRIAKWIESVCPETSVTNIFLGSKGVCSNYSKINGHQMNESAFDKESCSYSHSDTGWPTICYVDPSAFREKKLNDQDFLNPEVFTKNKKSVKLILSAIVDDFA